MFKKIISTVIILALSLSLISANVSTTKLVEVGKQPIKPTEYQKLLGKGLDVDWSKTSEGKKYYNEKTVQDFKNAGISHVRIRIVGDDNHETFKHLDKQIDDCIKNGLIPVIAYQADELKTNPNKQNIEKVVKWWGAVAERYKDKSYLLAFNLIIEPSDSLNGKPDELNNIYEQLVTEVRKSNPSRIVIIAQMYRSDPTYLKDLKIPSKHNGYLMAEWHFYAAGPEKNNKNKQWTTGTKYEKQLIQDKINTALKWQKDTGIPTWVGAWMPSNYNTGNSYSMKEQIAFSDYMTTSLETAKIPFAVNSDTKFYDRKTNKWYTDKKELFKTIFN